MSIDLVFIFLTDTEKKYKDCINQSSAQGKTRDGEEDEEVDGDGRRRAGAADCVESCPCAVYHKQKLTDPITFKQCHLINTGIYVLW